MRQVIWMVTLLLATPLVPAQEALGEEMPATAPAAIRSIDPQVEPVLRAWFETRRGRTIYGYRINDIMEQVQDDGQRLHFSHSRTITVRRPNQIRAEITGDLANKTLWYDGQTFTLLDRSTNLYAQVEGGGSISDMKVKLEEEYGLAFPISDLIEKDSAADLLGGVLTAQHLGIHMVSQHECHHLAFTQEDVDWEIWIDAGEEPIPRRIIIVYKNAPGQPQQIATLDAGTDLSRVTAGTFDFTPPPGSRQVELTPGR
jgi:hypothetical protein